VHDSPQHFDTYAALLASAAQQLTAALHSPVALSAACIRGCVHLLGLAIAPAAAAAAEQGAAAAGAAPSALSGLAVAGALARAVYRPGGSFGPGEGVRIDVCVRGQVEALQVQALGGEGGSSGGGGAVVEAAAAEVAAAGAAGAQLRCVWPPCLTAGQEAELLLLLQQGGGAGGSVRVVVYHQGGTVLADVEATVPEQDSCIRWVEGGSACRSSAAQLLAVR
jgi:hypothetical protein